MSIVKPQELKDYLSGVRLPDPATRAMPGMLDGAQGELEAWLGYSIEDDQPTITETVSVNREGRLMVSSWPVAEVISVATGDGQVINLGSTPDGTTYTFTGNGDWLINGQIFDATGYTVTYRPGLPARPHAVAKAKIMRVAAREVSLLHDDSRQNSGDPNGRRAAAPAPGWQKGEMRSLSRWRRRTVYSRPQDWLPGVGADYGTTYGGAGTEIGGVYTSASSAAIDAGDATVSGPGY